MVNTDGTAKGLRIILQERGINASSLKADDKKTILSNHDDLMKKKRILPSRCQSGHDGK